MPRLNVAVLLGGLSAERQVSLATGRQVLGALDPARYSAFPFDPACLRPGFLAPQPASDGMPRGLVGEDTLAGAPTTLAELQARRPDVALLCLHGRYGEDGTIQGLLEILGIPYTGSGVQASALAIDKRRTKELLAASGIPTPPAAVVRAPQEARERSDRPPLPLMVKPNREGSTLGATIVRQAEALEAAVCEALRYDDQVLLEQFIEGTELTGAVLGNRELQALPLIEIVPRGGFYDYHAKYEPGATEEIVPARISPEATSRAQEMSRRAHEILGCRGFSRTDFILSGEDLWVLELNTIPGMTPTSLLPRAAAAAGIGFPQLLDRMIELALEPVPS